MERIRFWFKDFSREIIIGVVASIMITAGVGVGAWLKQFDVFTISLLLLFALGVSMTLVNQFDAFFQRRKRQLAFQPYYYIGKTLGEWLYKRGFSIQDELQVNTDFQFLTRDFQLRPIHIGKLKNRDDVTIQAQLDFQEDAIKKMEELGIDNQAKLFGEIKIALARMQVQYSQVKMPIKFIKVDCTCALDESFTRDSFFEKVNRIRFALVTIAEILSPVLRQPEDKAELKPNA